MTDPAALARPRWRGQPHRLEVWYATFTDADETGYWIHYETVAPTTGDPYTHGWAAVFPVEGAPRVERFGPDRPTDAADVARGILRGRAGAVEWDVSFDDTSSPLWTFPRRVWERELLPAAQIVPWPRATFRGTVSVDGTAKPISARGAVARIYGHGNAHRWCWLHADLGDGAVVELVAATAHRRGLQQLPMVTMLQLRVPGAGDWPRLSLAAAPLLRAHHHEDGFVVGGVVGRRRVGINVHWPHDQSVTLQYVDPNGDTATCTNSERASAKVVLQKWRGKWQTERSWQVEHSAHAEIGRRP
ncbi:MAG TPA: hypothetical protein VHC63_14920 [Acidimicrobiales bacterium]|nr:hypothetical protein [Acidimicrobiales bacterium]